MVSPDNDFLPTVLISSRSVGPQIDRCLEPIKLFKSTLANKRNVNVLQRASVCLRSDLYRYYEIAWLSAQSTAAAAAAVHKRLLEHGVVEETQVSAGIPPPPLLPGKHKIIPGSSDWLQQPSLGILNLCSNPFECPKRISTF